MAVVGLDWNSFFYISKSTRFYKGKYSDEADNYCRHFQTNSDNCIFWV